MKISRILIVLFFLMAVRHVSSSETNYSPKPDEQQLPTAMHSPMKELPRITVGQSNADIIGNDNRSLQGAVDYIASLGGGEVLIGEGTYLMRDSLHLRPNVTVRGTDEKTILKKHDGAISPLAIDGDYGEEQITVVNPEGFQVGDGVTIWDDNAGGFHTTVARITGRNGNTFSISNPLATDCMIHNNAKAATVFPVVSGCNVEGVRVENLIVDGNKDNNVSLNGCRGAGIYLYRGFGTVLKNCVVRDFNGDGISFQQSNDVSVVECVSVGNAELGLHPGSGSQRPTIRNCLASRNGTDGLFLCWRVRHGVFENNVLDKNGRFGISIGHKDSDNLFRKNIARENTSNGIFFRNETLGMAGHRNRLEENIIENNGKDTDSAGIRIRGEVNGLIFRNNIIRDTRDPGAKIQTVGILIEDTVGDVILEGNLIDADKQVEDRRKKEE